jgi:hypothetical protein
MIVHNYYCARVKIETTTKTQTTSLSTLKLQNTNPFLVNPSNYKTQTTSLSTLKLQNTNHFLVNPQTTKHKPLPCQPSNYKTQTTSLSILKLQNTNHFLVNPQTTKHRNRSDRKIPVYQSRVLNASFNNISVISWRSVLLVEETRENHRPATSHCQTLSHNVVSSTPQLSVIRTHNVSGDRS